MQYQERVLEKLHKEECQVPQIDFSVLKSARECGYEEYIKEKEVVGEGKDGAGGGGELNPSIQPSINCDIEDKYEESKESEASGQSNQVKVEFPLKREKSTT